VEGQLNVESRKREAPSLQKEGWAVLIDLDIALESEEMEMSDRERPLFPMPPTNPKATNDSPYTRQGGSEPRVQMNLNLEPSVTSSTSEEERTSSPYREAGSPRAGLSLVPVLVSYSFDTKESAESPSLI
jgi:hypothetical protein